MTPRFLLASIFLLTAIVRPVCAQTPAFKLVVNSNQDTVQSDDGLTLREAIELANGTLTPDKLAAAEQAQVTVLPSGASRIEFNLPPEQTQIRLTRELPPLDRAGLTIDGTTQPGYAAQTPVIAELPLVAPIVSITPADTVEILRGLTITADGVSVRGLSLYGFTVSHTSTAATPPADIFIAHRLPPPDIRKQPTPANFSPFYTDDLPPKDVVIENNWLGISPAQQPGASRSAFGVSVFNATHTVIRRNWIAAHDGSAIITSVNATGLDVRENAIIGNGVAGMPDAIRLEGAVNQAQITGNLICGNDGSGVYLFKPDGAVRIQDNAITYNGRRYRRAAVYLMGSAHQVSGNQIRYQAGPGVVVAAYPRSRQNLIQANRFSNLEGLSIDLVTEFGTAGTDVFDYQRGDGPNPLRNTHNRRTDTGNAAIDAPQFASKAFLKLAAPIVQVFGTADPGSEVEIYRVSLPDDGYGPLAEPIAHATTTADGHFSAALDRVKPGDRISAIATDPRYGTSEPARSAVIGNLDGSLPTSSSSTGEVPRCTTPPAPPQPTPPVPTPPAPIRIQVPTSIHFALDKDNISPASARVLDRIAQVLREHPTILIDIEGHTDPRASDAYNLDLGARRAKSARNYLLRRGIAPERMTIRSLGERRLKTPGRSRLDYARDRRAEFIFRDANNVEVIVQEADLQIEP